MVLPPKYCLSSCQLSSSVCHIPRKSQRSKRPWISPPMHPMICIQSMWQLPPIYQPSYRRNVAEATNARHVFGAADLGLLSCKKLGFSTGKPGQRQNTSNKLIGRSLGLCTTQKVLLPESSLAAKFAANLVLGSILSVAILGYTLDLGISRIYLKTWRSIKICLKQDQPFCGNSHHIKHLHTAPYT